MRKSVAEKKPSLLFKATQPLDKEPGTLVEKSCREKPSKDMKYTLGIPEAKPAGLVWNIRESDVVTQTLPP